MIGALALLLAAPLADLRVGQDADSARIEVVCSAPCEGRLEGRALLLVGVTDAFAVTLEGPVERIELVGNEEGALLTYEADRPVASATIAACAASVCLDLRFAPPEDGTLRALLSAQSGEPLGAADCADAAERLARDAWDLTAFRTAALCEAAAGRVREAASLLDRLLAYRPDPVAARARALLADRLDGRTARR